jgi:hypothetical protein
MDATAAQVETGEIQRFWLMLEQAQACIDERVSSDAWSTTEMRLDRSRLWLARKLPSGLSEGLSIKLAPLFATSHAAHKTRLSRRDRLELMYVIAGSSRGIRLECSVNPLARLLDLQRDSPKETLRIAWAGAAGDSARAVLTTAFDFLARHARADGWLTTDADTVIAAITSASFRLRVPTTSIDPKRLNEAMRTKRARTGLPPSAN